jgi:hypothetical protein
MRYSYGQNSKNATSRRPKRFSPFPPIDYSHGSTRYSRPTRHRRVSFVDRYFADAGVFSGRASRPAYSTPPTDSRLPGDLGNNAVERDQQQDLHPSFLAEAMISEMEVLHDAIRTLQSTVQVFFYVNNYPDLVRQFPHAQFRTDNTPLQKHYAAIMVSTLELVMTQAKKVMKTPPAFFRGDLQASQMMKTLLVTHYAWDLTSAKYLGDTELIESHTGKIKPPSQWYTKYYQGKDYPMIPFRRGFLPIFGDDTLFRPFPKAARESIVELAVKYDWTNVTSLDRLRLGLDQLSDKYLKAVIVAMLN